MIIPLFEFLSQFPNTSSRAVMDIKIGTRTFLESEVANRSRRADLYRKMMELAPDEPTKEVGHSIKRNFDLFWLYLDNKLAILNLL